ncbi:MAG: cytosine permease [Gammaproteobacteria bacterium]|nr:cytosine permease [Gammaproteobacteria bacterium]
MSKLKSWWSYDSEAERHSADNPVTPLDASQRRGTVPLLTLAFGWGFLVTGLFVGGMLGSGQIFWPDIVQASFAGNLANFVIGALVGYIGYRTACNSGLLYQLVYGKIGAYIPVLVIALLLIGWQGIVVGAFGVTWAGNSDSVSFYLIAIAAGILFTFTTYFGVKGLEYVSIPSVVILVAVGLYAAWLNVDQAGGWSAFLELSAQRAAESEAPLTMLGAVNLVIGSWIVGAIVMPEYTRFARKAWVAIAIPFIALLVAQWFLQIVGALGGVVSGTFDFTVYLRSQGTFLMLSGIIGMSLALWTTGDANLYLPVIQTSAVFRRPQHVMTVICGVLGTIVGLGIYARFMDWINLLASIVPPLIGPVIAHYYFIARMRFSAEELDRLAVWNPAAIIAYMVGAIAAILNSQNIVFSTETTVPALLGLVISMLTYLIAVFLGLGHKSN